MQKILFKYFWAIAFLNLVIITLIMKHLTGSNYFLFLAGFFTGCFAFSAAEAEVQK